MLLPCPFCGRVPRFFFADDEFNEIDDRYAYEFGPGDPDEAACKSWLKENLDYIAYYGVVECSCGAQLITKIGGIAEDLKQDAARKWNRRRGADLCGS